MPDDRVIPFYSLKLSDLVYAKARLVVWCGACRREGRLDVLPLIGRRGPAFGVKEVAGILTCAACGRKGFANITVEWF